MKLIVRRFFLILIMLWLPLQGVFAAGVPLWTHERNTGTMNVDVISVIDDHLHTIRREQTMDHNMTFNQECEVNTLCHVSCSTFISPALSTAIPSDSSSYTVLFISKSTSFIPEQLQRPPLA